MRTIALLMALAALAVSLGHAIERASLAANIERQHRIESAIDQDGL